MAQLVEQRIRNAWVAGSSPASGSKHRIKLKMCLIEGKLISFPSCYLLTINSINLY